MAAFARTDLDVLGLARRDNQAAVQLFAIRDGKAIARDVFLLETPGTTDAEASSPASSSSTTPGHERAPRDRDPGRAARCPELEVFLADAGASRRARPRPVRASLRDRSLDPGRGHGLGARRGRSAACAQVPRRGERRTDGPRRPQRGGDARARAGPLAGRPGQDPRRARGAGGGALALPAPPARIECYDISTIQGTNTVGEHGRLRGRPAADGRVPALPRSGRSRARTTSPATRRCCAGASGARSGEEGSAEELRWAPARPGGHRRRPGQVNAAGRARRAGSPRHAGRRPGQGARGAVPAGPAGPDRPAADVAGPLPAAAAPRRGPPLRHHLPPQAPRQASVRSALDDLPGVGPRRASGAASRLRLDQAIREAPVEQIASVPGIGPAMAARIKAGLGGVESYGRMARGASPPTSEGVPTRRPVASPDPRRDLAPVSSAVDAQDLRHPHRRHRRACPHRRLLAAASHCPALIPTVAAA